MSMSKRLLPLAALISLSLAGCDSSSEPVPTITTTITSTAAEEATMEASSAGESSEPSQDDDVAAAAKDAYFKVLENPSVYPVHNAEDYELDGKFRYALVEATGDEIPELLLQVGGKEYSPVIVFAYKESTNEAKQIQEVLIRGASGAGGHRLQVWASRSGNGLYQIENHSIQPEALSTLFVVNTMALVAASPEENFDINYPLEDHHPVVWFASDDPEGMEIVQGVGGTAEEPDISTNVTKSSEVTPDDGNYRFTGKVVVKTNEELMGGGEMPNNEPRDNEHIVLVLDTPVEVTAQSYAGPRSSQTAVMTEISLPGGYEYGSISGNPWASYIGQRITITSSPDQLKYPSDTSMPLGVVRVTDFISVD